MRTLGAFGAFTLVPFRVLAESSRERALRELLDQSSCCIVGTPRAASSAWEELAGRRRIVTYSEVAVDEMLGAGAAGGDAVLVRTLGGRVDGIGQWVPSEAHLRLGARSLLFLVDLRDGTHGVAGMAGGHYRLEGARLASERDVATRVDTFDGMLLDELRSLIARELDRGR